MRAARASAARDEAAREVEECRAVAVDALVEIQALMDLMIREIDRLRLPEALRGIACRTLDLADIVSAVVIEDDVDDVTLADLLTDLHGRTVGDELHAAHELGETATQTGGDQ
ncbi:MAG: hypothetical protein V4750_14765 [Pseudomonadota bacterium]